ncbi:hypothetical protein ACWDE9_23225, partial [Streptomyces olivaceoviridis]
MSTYVQPSIPVSRISDPSSRVSAELRYGARPRAVTTVAAAWRPGKGWEHNLTDEWPWAWTVAQACFRCAASRSAACVRELPSGADGGFSSRRFPA